MLMRRSVYTLLILSFLALNVSAQTRTVSGKVMSSNGLPVAGATINVKGARKSTTVAAGENGAFSFPLPANNSVMLEVSAVGFETKEVPLGPEMAGENLSIVLKES